MLLHAPQIILITAPSKHKSSYSSSLTRQFLFILLKTKILTKTTAHMVWSFISFSPCHSLHSNQSLSLLGLFNKTGTRLPQGLCLYYSLCLEHSSPRDPQDSFSLLHQVFTQISPLQWGLSLNTLHITVSLPYVFSPKHLLPSITL